MKIDIVKRVAGNFKQRDKDHVAEFLPVYDLINEESVNVLDKYKVTLTRNSQVDVLTQDAKTLEQTLSLASKMNFLDAYNENPRRLNILVADVIKRMSKCDAIGIPYKTDKGYANFLFSEKLFKEMTSSLTSEQKKIITPPSLDESKPNEEQVLDAIVTKFDFPQDVVIKLKNKLEELKEQDLSLKEKLMQTLAIVNPSDMEFLEKTINSTMEEMNIKEEKGLVA